MSGNPPAVPAPPPASSPQSPPGSDYQVKWYQSQQFVAVCKVVAVYVLFWLGIAFQTHVWDFYSLGAGVVSGLTILVQDWWSPTVVAPFAVLNKNNPHADPPK